MANYKSKHYTGEQIDQRLLQGFFDDVKAAGYTGSKEQFDKGLSDVLLNFSNKVDKVAGKGLSSNDFSNSDKSKLDGVEENANNYELPIASDAQLGGVKVSNSSVNDTSIPPATLSFTTYDRKCKIKNGFIYFTYYVPSYAASNIDGLIRAADKRKLDSIEASANNYTLPIASSSTLGGVKIGSGLNIDSNGIISVHNSLYEFVQDKASLVAIESPDPNKIYIVLDDIAGEDNNNCTEYVWVVDPSIGANGMWEKLGEYTPTVNLSNFYNKTEIDALSTQLTNLINARLTIDSFNTWSETVALKSELDTKVDKVEGKGLSTNDYSNIDKGTVSKVKIIHPITGISVIPSASDVLLSLIKYDFPSGEDLDSNVSFPVATSTTAGLVTASDKAILEELKRTTDITSRFKAKSNTDGSITFGWKSGIVSGDSYNYTIPLASTTQSGLMSKEDKVKLNNINVANSEYLQGTIEVLHSGNSFKLECQSVKFSDDDDYVFYDINIPIATNSACGLLSKEDKVKLDNLSSGGSSAITEYTEAEITALLNQINF